ncbi:hypothetical protein [Streptomyces phaeoluteigriseus]
MTGKRALARVWLVAAVVTAAATGCTSGGGGEGSGGGAGRGSGPEPLTWQQELRVADALQRLTKRCMNRHGFTYWEDRTLTLRESRPVRYVQDDMAWARTYGYGAPVEAKNERTRLHNPNAAYRRGLSAAARAAFDEALDGGGDARTVSARLPGGAQVGKRVGGCTAEAEEALYGDPAAWFRAAKTATGLRALYGEDLMRDERLTAAVRAWSQCMKGAGLAYADPQAARDAIRVNTARLGPARADEAFALERRTAVADAGCAREADLRSVAAAREAHYVDRLRDRYGDSLDTYERLQRQAYDRAVRIVPPRA